MGLQSLPAARRRHAVMLAILAISAALLIALNTGHDEAVARHYTTRMSLPALRELARLSVGAPDSSHDDPALPVTIVQEGGPLFVTQAVREAVQDISQFTEAPSRHLLRAEVVGDLPAFALSFRLSRRGWDLRSPKPVLVFVAPWCGLAAGFAGALVAWLVRRLWVGLALAATFAQLGIAVLPRPDIGLGPLSWMSWLAQGPVARTVVAGDTEDMVSTTVLLAIAATTAALAWFTARRRPSKTQLLASALMVAAGVGAAFGVVIWLEAAGRFGAFSLIASWRGVASWVVLLVTWGVAAWFIRSEHLVRG